MTIPREILSPVIEQMRSWRKHGDSVSAILGRLWPSRSHLDILRHMKIAFCSGSLPNYEMFPKDDKGLPRADAVDRILGQQIDEARPKWESAPPYPDLYRRRDRHAFRAVAADFHARILVAATDIRAAQFIGHVGYRPCPPGLWAVPRIAPPHAGLLGADPGDSRFRELLQRQRPGSTYEDYCRDLAANGFRVSGEDSGYVIRDQADQAFYPGYYLLGAYGEEKSENLWKGRQAEQIRFELNQRMGEDLVQYGPHDLWEARGEGEGAVKPPVPVLVFEPDGNVDVRLTLASLQVYYRSRYLPCEHLSQEDGE